MIHFFCPECWSEVPADASRCEACDYDLDAHAALPFDEKLIRALRSPVAQTQRMAIYLLGRRASCRALPALEALLSSSSDPYVLREIFEALWRIPGSRSQGLLREATRHPSPVVARAAREALAKRRASPGPGSSVPEAEGLP